MRFFSIAFRSIVILTYSPSESAVSAQASRVFDANEVNLFSSDFFNRILSGLLYKTPTSVAK